MDDIDTLLNKAIAQDGGAVKVSMIISDLAKVAPIYADEETRPVALAILAEWEVNADALRKGLTAAWLSSAKAAFGAAAGKAGKVAGKVGSAVKSASGRANEALVTAEGKAGDLGARVGEKYGRSSLTATARGAAAEAGGADASARMAERFKPNTSFDESRAPKMSAPPARPANLGPGFVGDAEFDARASKHAAQTRAFEQGQQQSAFRPRMLDAPAGGGAQGRMSGPRPHTPMEQKILATAHTNGAANAENAFAGAHARQGRVIARHAFKAGIATAGGVAGVGAAVANGALSHGGGTLSQKQHEERVNAGKHSHQGHG